MRFDSISVRITFSLKFKFDSVLLWIITGRIKGGGKKVYKARVMKML